MEIGAGFPHYSRISRPASPDPAIRAATAADAGALAPLLADLGYPAAAPVVAGRLSSLLADPHGAVVVADRDGNLVGLAAFYAIPLLERARPLGRLSALVVAEGGRGRGVGRLLLDRVELEARALGCDRVEVTTGERRGEAHEFYTRAGFAETPRRFLKELPRG